MATVTRTLLDSALADRYDMTMIISYRAGSLGGRLAEFLSALWALWGAVREQGPMPIVHVHTAARGSMYRKGLVIETARRGGAYVVVHVHTGAGRIRQFAESLGRFRRRLLSRALNSADVLISVSGATERELERCFGVTKSIVIDNPLPGPMPTLQEPGGEDGSVLYLGGFADPVKGAAVLVEALELLAGRGLPVDAVFAGDGEPSDRTLAVASWKGWLAGEEKERAIRAASVIAIPSTSEGLPIALLEAMSYGKAVVATRVGGIPDVLTDRRDGLLVAGGDADALAVAIAELKGDAELRRTLGRHARERAGDFSLDRAVDRLDRLYRNMLDGRIAA